jgi:hypothetical protein
MMSRMAAVSMILAASMASVSAQARRPAGPTTVIHDITIKADAVYTGTMELTTDRGKVTGKMHITAPTEVTGTVAGTSNKGVMALDFPFFMTEQKCEGNVKMDIALPPKVGPAAGTLEVVGCGRDATNKLTGTIDLKPVAAAPKPVKN